jgi:hypothetical protein
MPALSMFYGIVIRMQSEKGGTHTLPHLPAIYGDHEMVLSLVGEALEGDLPSRQKKLVLAWIALHEDELKANWTLLSEGEGYFKIDPLK